MNLDLDIHLSQYLNNPESSKAEWNVLVKEGLERQLHKDICESISIYKAEPVFYHLTLRMNEKWMRQFSRKSSYRTQVIWDITSMLLGKINLRLVKHPNRTCSQQYNLRFWTATENRTQEGSYTDDHSHTLLMVNPKHIEKWSNPNQLGSIVQSILHKSRPFTARGIETHLARDCHSVDVKHITTPEQFQKTTDYGLKTAADRDTDNAFTITNQNSWRTIYAEQNDARQNPYLPSA